MNSTQFVGASKMRHAIFLVVAVCAVALAIGYLGGERAASNVLTALITVTSGAFAAFTVMMIIRSKNRQNFVFSLLLAVFGMLWFAAESLWTYYNNVRNVQSSVTMADPIWLAGYCVLLVYLMNVMWPIRKSVSRKILLSSALLALSYLIPSIIDVSNNSSFDNYETVINLLYPVADAVLLVPLIIGFSLFDKTGRSLFRPLLVGLLISIATDTLFLFAEIGNSYYFGNPIELGFVAAYIILAYGAYTQYRFMTVSQIPIAAYLKSSVVKRPDDMVVFSSMSLIATTAAIVLSLSLVQIYHFENLSTREIMVFQPVVYGSIVSVLASCAVVVILGKKFSSLKSQMDKMQASKTVATREETREHSAEMPARLELVQRRLESMENTGKKTTYVVLMMCGVVAAALLFYMFHNVYPTNVDMESGRFVIEDLNGKKIDTWAVWNLIDGEPFHVSIINSNLLTPDKIDAIKYGILSEETIVLSDSELGNAQSGEKNTYYKGWKGALQTLSDDSTSAYLPKDFDIEESSAPTGNIWIILSKDHSSDGDPSSTRSIVDGDNHQILKSIITIHDVENLDGEELAAITRHEFGHALGLYSSEASDKFLYHSSNLHVAYISACNLLDLVSLYNENTPSHSFCT